MRLAANPVKALQLYIRSRSASNYAARNGAPGMEFDAFGRKLGRKLLLSGRKGGLEYLLTPVSNVRYFEFSFAQSCLPAGAARCLDVSSPRLFSLHFAAQHPECEVEMINPDATDLKSSQHATACLGLTNVKMRGCSVEALEGTRDTYDCIWSISVVEHIDGERGDQRAVETMFNALKVGGRLLLTIPVDRTAWDEFRDTKHYGSTTHRSSSDKYFFQRFYDFDAIQARLLQRLSRSSITMRWFGETSPGRFNSYVQDWMDRGLECSAEDAREITDHYREYPSWQEMPGMGICGLMIEKL